MPLLDTAYLDQAYNYNTDTLQTLDVWLVKNRTVHTPLVVLIHGGGWIGGNKETTKDYVMLFVNSGINVISIDYRLTTLEPNSPRCKDLMDDVHSVIKYTLANASKWNIRKNNYVLWGGSAGAHLALLYAYEYDKENVVSSAIGIGTPAKLNDTCWNNIPVYRAVANAALGRFLGIVWTGDTANKKTIAASPYYSKTFKPTLMIHGEKDSVVPRSQAELMYKLLQERGVESRYILLKNGGHVGDGTSQEDLLATFKALTDWIKKYGSDDYKVPAASGLRSRVKSRPV